MVEQQVNVAGKPDLGNRLRPQDWKSGDRREGVEIVAPFGGAVEMMKDLEEKVFGKD